MGHEMRVKYSNIFALIVVSDDANTCKFESRE